MSPHERLVLLALTVAGAMVVIAWPVVAVGGVIVAAAILIADVIATREHDPVPPLWPIDDEPWRKGT